MRRVRIFDSAIVDRGLGQADPLKDILGTSVTVDLNGIPKFFDSNSVTYESGQGIFGQNNAIYELESQDGYPVLKQEITVKAPDQSTVEDLIALGQSIPTNSDFLNHKCELQIPYQDVEPDDFNYNPYESRGYAYYNLKNPAYEQYSRNADEKSMPNFLIGALYEQQGIQGNLRAQTLYSMEGSIPELINTKMLEFTSKDELGNATNYGVDNQYMFDYETSDITQVVDKDYFKKFLQFQQPEFLSSTLYSQENTNVYSNYDLSYNSSLKVGNAPFYNRINMLAKMEDNPISDIFHQTGMGDFLLKIFRSGNSFQREFFANNNVVSIKTVDLLQEIENFTYNSLRVEENEMFLNDVSNPSIMTTSSPFLFYFYKLLNLGKLRNKIKPNLRKFEDLIINNNNHHVEQVGFKVHKFLEDASNPIQTFYFLTLKEATYFIDTQIKFDRTYRYSVRSMFVVFGSSYSYENVRTRKSNFSTWVNSADSSISTSEAPTELTGDLVRFRFVVKPSIKMIELETASYMLRVVEPPPLAPEITFYNEDTSRNKLKIRIEHQHGNLTDEYSRKPLTQISESDQTYIDRLKEYFKSDNVLVFSGKTASGRYEVFRMESPPKSYKDFEGNLYATIQSNVIYNNGERSKNMLLIDYIKYQRKYYYAIRPLTHNGNPGQISSVFQVEMYQDADETFLTVEDYNFPEDEDRTNSITMRKFIQIMPSIEHQLINQDNFSITTTADDALGDLKLGIEENLDAVWNYSNQNKFFKLRLESKNTGKKIDLNLFFKLKKPQ